jgi:hypothetical protein
MNDPQNSSVANPDGTSDITRCRRGRREALQERLPEELRSPHLNVLSLYVMISGENDRVLRIGHLTMIMRRYLSFLSSSMF